MRRLWLASGSPRRAELLRQIGVPFEQMRPPDVDESRHPDESPEACVQRLASAKARAGWRALDVAQRSDAIVLGADTLVEIDGDVLGKPGPGEAREMLRRLSGRRHRVLTAFSLVGEGILLERLVSTCVHFVEIDEDLMIQYLATGEGNDKAGAYGIQGLGGLLVASLEGSYGAVVGLPLAETAQALRRLGLPVLVTGEGANG